MKCDLSRQIQFMYESKICLSYRKYLRVNSFTTEKMKRNFSLAENTFPKQDEETIKL